MKRLTPVIVLVAFALIVAALILSRPEPASAPPERPVTKVEVITVEPETIQLTVSSQGTILPKIESDLSVEVAGRIVELSPNFNVGQRITEGEVLFRIDSADYEAAVAARKADLASAKLSLAQEQALAEQAHEDWDAVGEGEPSELALRLPQLAKAKAQMESAAAALSRAERDLERTVLQAPYDGLVLTKNVDLGQYVQANPNIVVARVYSTDVAEIRLPLTQRETDNLVDPSLSPSKVILKRQDAWEASLTRLESTIDPSTRLIYGVAEIENPLEKGLRRGLFVEAEIAGRTINQAISIPRYALRGSSAVYIVTEQNTLMTRTVDVLQSDEEQVIITEGLEQGDRVVTSPIAFFVENMPVEILENE